MGPNLFTDRVRPEPTIILISAFNTLPFFNFHAKNTKLTLQLDLDVNNEIKENSNLNMHCF